MKADKPRNQSKILLRLPKSVGDTAEQLADQEGVSLNEFISLAVEEKISRVDESTSPVDTQAGFPGHPAE